MAGPRRYRERVAEETAKVGQGLCMASRPYSREEYNALMAGCSIIVCPRGWGEQSERHWDRLAVGKASVDRPSGRDRHVWMTWLKSPRTAAAQHSRTTAAP
jgi:predicted amidohydrolase